MTVFYNLKNLINQTSNLVVAPLMQLKIGGSGKDPQGVWIQLRGPHPLQEPPLSPVP